MTKAMKATNDRVEITRRGMRVLKLADLKRERRIVARKIAKVEKEIADLKSKGK
ncbi:MAG: hypothetical protein PHU85_20485 [Phycisphaerae bacterium]|nr:hypothetical protein [Phycisphaerae bacterium]